MKNFILKMLLVSAIVSFASVANADEFIIQEGDSFTFINKKNPKYNFSFKIEKSLLNDIFIIKGSSVNTAEKSYTFVATLKKISIFEKKINKVIKRIIINDFIVRKEDGTIFKSSKDFLFKVKNGIMIGIIDDIMVIKTPKLAK